MLQFLFIFKLECCKHTEFIIINLLNEVIILLILWCLMEFLD